MNQLNLSEYQRQFLESQIAQASFLRQQYILRIPNFANQTSNAGMKHDDYDEVIKVNNIKQYQEQVSLLPAYSSQIQNVDSPQNQQILSLMNQFGLASKRMKVAEDQLQLQSKYYQDVHQEKIPYQLITNQQKLINQLQVPYQQNSFNDQIHPLLYWGQVHQKGGQLETPFNQGCVSLNDRTTSIFIQIKITKQFSSESQQQQPLQAQPIQENKRNIKFILKKEQSLNKAQLTGSSWNIDQRNESYDSSESKQQNSSGTIYGIFGQQELNQTPFHKHSNERMDNSTKSTSRMSSNRQLLVCSIKLKDIQKQEEGFTIKKQFESIESPNQKYNKKWRRQIQAQITDELSNDMYRQRRNELLQVLESNYSNKSIIFCANSKRQNEDLGRKTFRGSVFRGVSKNKSKWQMMIMGNFKKIYIGAIDTELEAALLYDKIAILVHGLQAKTNFEYTVSQIQLFLEEEKKQILTLE
eukprot:403355594